MQVVENLREIIYEPVTDEYGWGKYGEFRVLIRKSDGYVNATKLCKDGGKELFSWTRLETSKRFIKEAESAIHICMADLMASVSGGQNTEIRGTYVHQDLIPHIASWISPAFAIKVSRIVNNFLVQEYKDMLRAQERVLSQKDTLLEEKESTIDSLKKELKDFREEARKREIAAEKFREESKQRDMEAQAKLDLANENIVEAVRGIDKANTSIGGLHTTLNKTCEMHVPPSHLQRKDTETYALWFCGSRNGTSKYVQCRARPNHLSRRKSEIRARYRTTFREVLEITPIANARSLASEFERRIVERGAIIDLKYQSISISQSQLSEQEMVEIAQEVFGERVAPARDAVEECPKIRVVAEEKKTPSGVKIRIAPDKEYHGNEYEEQFTELMKKKMDDLKAIAREFPKDIKTFGGWSGKPKVELVHWILCRRGAKP